MWEVLILPLQVLLGQMHNLEWSCILADSMLLVGNAHFLMVVLQCMRLVLNNEERLES